jgi:hypothetical protein
MPVCRIFVGALFHQIPDDKVVPFFSSIAEEFSCVLALVRKKRKGSARINKRGVVEKEGKEKAENDGEEENMHMEEKLEVRTGGRKGGRCINTKRRTVEYIRKRNGNEE